MLQAVKMPRVLTRQTAADSTLPAQWEAMSEAERTRHVRAAQALAEGIVAEARRTLGEHGEAGSNSNADASRYADL